ncbi:hypothetical protein JCM14036_06700 [Desulfotomaculum defluvii]
MLTNKKRNILTTIVLLFILLHVSYESGNLGNAYYKPKNIAILPNGTNGVPLTHFELNDLVKSTSEALQYGDRLDYDNLGLIKGKDLKDILLNAKTGMCDDFSYLFLREINGRNPWRLYNIYQSNGIIHSVVGVWAEGKWLIYDATLGIQYPASFEEMYNNPELAEVNYDNKFFELYYGQGFFKDIYTYQVYTSLDQRDSNRLLPTNISYINQGNFYKGFGPENLFDYNNSSYCSGDTDFLDISFKQANVYRIVFSWYDDTRHFEDFHVTFYLNGKQVYSKQFENFVAGYRTEAYLGETIIADQIVIRVKKSTGKPMFLLSKLYLY